MAVIEAEGLVKTYHPRGAPTVHALAGLDLEVPEGTVLGLLGPNGAGKTPAVKVPPRSSARMPAGRRSTAWTSSRVAPRCGP